MARNLPVSPTLAAIFWFAGIEAISGEVPGDLSGRWGDDRQCRGAILMPGGTVRAAPFEIGPDWLRHGAIWCRLDWLPAQPCDGGVYVAARARCGEDARRGYWLGLSFEGAGEDARLTLIWDDQAMNGPLRRCD